MYNIQNVSLNQVIMKKTLFTLPILFSFLLSQVAYAGNVYDMKQFLPIRSDKTFTYQNNLTGVDFYLESYPWGDGVHSTLGQWSNAPGCTTEHNVFAWFGDTHVQTDSYQFDNNTYTQENNVWADRWMEAGAPAKSIVESRVINHLNAPNCNLSGSSESYWYSQNTTTWRALYDGIQELIPYSQGNPMFPSLTPVVRLDNTVLFNSNPDDWWAEQFFFANYADIGWTLVGIEIYRHIPGQATIEIFDVKLKAVTNR